MSERFPALFVSHGAPSLALDALDPTYQFLSQIGHKIGKPQAVLVVSAHWEESAPVASAVARPETIYDFRGFPDALYEIRYPAPGAPVLANQVADLLVGAGIEAGVDSDRGLDHGAWIPMMLMYPDADIPVTQLSVQTSLGSGHHLAIGKALRPLRDEGVLILASGGLTHNLRELIWNDASASMPAWVAEFRNWVVDAIEQGRTEDLLRYRSVAPNAVRNHPSEEHFLPLFVALGAGGNAVRIHEAVAYGSLAMDAFRFA